MLKLKQFNIWNLSVRCYTYSKTIFALSSGFGKCGVSVIRVSGPHTREALRNILGSGGESLKERYAHLRSLYHPKTKEMIDKGLVLWFPGPASFTGEDCCEFQVHGSLAVISALLEALSELDGLKPAEPGEFTKRAFYNNKLDLTEVEGLADLIHAETEAQRKQALLQSTGVLSRLYLDWRKRLIRCAAHLEAFIDFAEDENIEESIIESLTSHLKQIHEEITQHLNDQRQGELLRQGVYTAIAGEPNVGKSSFMNLICQRNISIVSDIAGTTRDIIQHTYNFAGYPVRFADTAGLRTSTADAIELEGIARAKQCLQESDLILFLLDASKLRDQKIYCVKALDDYLDKYLKSLGLSADLFKKKRLQFIANKIDSLLPNELFQLQKNLTDVLYISCKDQSNISEFLLQFQNILKELCGIPLAESPRLTNIRHRQHLKDCIKYINLFLTVYMPERCPDLAISAQVLRKSVKCIEGITGHVSTDEVLNIIFKEFCVGK